MTQNYALLSIVYMMVFVILFDWAHRKARNTRFCEEGLMTQQDIEHLRNILSACQEG